MKAFSLWQINRVDHLWKPSIALFWVLGSGLQSPLSREPSSASLEMRASFLGVAVPRDGFCGVGRPRRAPGVRERNAAPPPLGWSLGKRLRHPRSLPFPPGEAAFSWLRLRWHKIQSRAQIPFKPKSPSWNKIAPPDIPVALLSAVLRCSCCGEGRCCSEERKNIKQIASVKQLLRWMSQICLVVLGLFIAIGFACDVVCRVTLHPSWLLPFFS